MLDDDIQYLGSRIKLKDPPRCLQRTVTGIVLYVEKSDESEAHTLRFDRDESSSILVGRRPGTENESRTLDQENPRAMFRCAVVSRRHAKIVFMNSGNVFIIDLDSHHGTHIRKPGETSSKMLASKIPIQLSDGDIITFGKTVGRNEEMVRPIVARVQLLHGGSSTATIKPLVVPDTLADGPYSSRCVPTSPSSSSSDEAYNGQSDVYSDCEEISPPSHVNVTPADVPQAESESKTESHLGRAFEVLRRFLPTPPVPAVQSQCDASPRPDERSRQFGSLSSSMISPSPLPPLWSLPTSRISFTPRYPSVDLPDQFIDLPPINPVKTNHVIDFSGSDSPMDLASPSPLLPEQVPFAVSAWADVSSTSPDPMPIPVDNEVLVADNIAEMPVVAANTTVQHEDNHGPVSFERNKDNPSSSFATFDQGKQKEQNPAMDPSLFVMKSEYQELQARYTKIQTEIDILQAQRRKYKSKFNANVHTVAEKFQAVEDQIHDLTTRFTMSMNQIEGNTSGDISDIQARIDDLVNDNDIHQISIDELRRRFDLWDMHEDNDEATKIQEEREGAQKYLTILKDSIDEMNILRATTEREVGAELKLLRQLREIMQREGAPLISVKRKRQLDDEDDCYNDNNGTAHPEEPVIVNGNHVPHLHPHYSHDRPSSRKRARKIAAVAAQTATALTMGAVFTWAALAFA